MASDIKIAVTVYVSDALKEMFGCRDVPDCRVPEAVMPAPADVPPAWQTLFLRRDGQRPLSFTGLPLLDRRCAVDDPAGTVEQALTLYIAQDGEVFAALAFVPSEGRAAWASYRCQAIQKPTDFVRFLQDWHPEQCFSPPAAAGTHSDAFCPASLFAARSTFNSMAADCLSPAVLQG